ncbi:MAG: cysteine desulfurase family protein [Bythopirellula sp.]|nr:cysteine desulfurase family protein [Bythopirellula sp.]
MPSPSFIYMDNHATTRADPRVLEAMLPYFTDEYGNAGSVNHHFGDVARHAVAEATASLAFNLGADPAEILFTSGATESNNLAVRGVAERNQRRGKHLLSVRTEHRAVLEPLERLGQHEFTVTLLDVEQHGSPRAGWLDPEKVAEAIQDDTVLVSVMLANNEIGVIQPLAEIAAVCRHRGVLLHCDATQAVGKIPVNVRDLGVDLMSFTAHKIYGPKGIGALYVRQGSPTVRFTPQITGGGQQGGRRSGTLNVPGIVGFAKALELCEAELSSEETRQAGLRQRLWAGLQRNLDGLELCGPQLDATIDHPLRLPGNLNVAFGDVDGEALLLEMGTLAVSSGATCSSHEPGPSHVLLALGLGEDLARSSLRFGLGRFNTAAEIDAAVEIVSSAVKKLRGMG